MPVIDIHSRIRDYQVHIGPAGDYLQDLLALENKAFLVDNNVWQYHSAGILNGLPPAEMLLLPASEERKTLEGAQELFDYMLARSAKRNMTLITIGGGILQDARFYPYSGPPHLG